MRLVKKHAEVGYQTPGQRPGCRNCIFFEQGNREGCSLTNVTLCLKHGLEVTSGGLCPDFRETDWRGLVDDRTLPLEFHQVGELA